MKHAANILVGRTFKIIALAIGLTAFLVLIIFGFAIWVFIPLMPAAVVFLFSIASFRGKGVKRAPEADTDYRKAA